MIVSPPHGRQHHSLAPLPQSPGRTNKPSTPPTPTQTGPDQLSSPISPLSPGERQLPHPPGAASQAIPLAADRVPHPSAEGGLVPPSLDELSTSPTSQNLRQSLQQSQAHRRQRSQKRNQQHRPQEPKPKPKLSVSPASSTPSPSPQKGKKAQIQHKELPRLPQIPLNWDSREEEEDSTTILEAVRYGQQQQIPPDPPQKGRSSSSVVKKFPAAATAASNSGTYPIRGHVRSNSRNNSFAVDGQPSRDNASGASRGVDGAGRGGGYGPSYGQQDYVFDQALLGGAGPSDDTGAAVMNTSKGKKGSGGKATTQGYMFGYSRPGLVSQQTAPASSASMVPAAAGTVGPAAPPATLVASTSAPPQTPPTPAQIAVSRLRAGSSAAANPAIARAAAPPLHFLAQSAAPPGSSAHTNAAAAAAAASSGANDKNHPHLTLTTSNTSVHTNMSDRAPLTPASNQQHQPVFKHEGGRRWLRDPTLPYPLPVDLEELHRQSLRLLLLIRLFRAPLCNEIYSDNAGTTIAPPRAPASVLEVACGAALWSSACHDYFRKSGRPDVQFTGMDIAPLAPDLRSTGGVNWRFVQHDMRRVPWPFADGEFDFIFVKDADFCERDMQAKSASKNEINRVLAHGGVVEVWSCDHVFRTLLPKPPIPPGTSEEDAEQAEACGAYVISASTPFAASQNRYLADYNAWVEQALGKRHLSPSPCGLTEWALRIQAESIETVSSRRLALPFGETRWEKEKQKRVLSSSQASLRRVALLTSLQFIEAMEPVLRTESGKTQDEWDRWWAGMMKDLLEENGAASGECLEVGAWWAVKN